MTTLTPRPTSSSRPARGFWPMRDLPTLGWLVAAVVATVVHQWVPEPRWLMIHLLVLGAVGHAILVWSRYFADTLLRCAPTPRRVQNLRLATFNGGVVAVVVGMLAEWWWVTLVGGVALAGAVLWHGVVLARQLRGALGSRFAPTVRFYVAAAALHPVGAGMGVWMAGGLTSPLHEQARAAHVALNVFGWIGLTVLGTLVTLWPTILRTRMDEAAGRAARRALPVLLIGLAALVTSALVNLRLGYAAGLVVYLGGVGLLAVPAVRVARAKPPTTFAAWSVAAALGWLVACLVTLVVMVASAPDWVAVDSRTALVTPLLAVGFAGQVLLGALSYLVPVVLGGGPAAVRATNRAVDAGSSFRVVATNAGIVVCALPGVPSLVRVITSLLVVGVMAAFVPILLRAIAVSVRTRRAGDSGGDTAGVNDPAHSPAPPDGARPAGQRTGLAAAGLATVMLCVAAGAALDPAALDQPVASASAGVVATGETTHVEVVARDMRFEPSTIEVPAGNALVITLVNADDADSHDLVLETGAKTDRLAPGESATVEVGVVGQALEGWCSVVGHRQMGMTLDVRVSGTPMAQTPPAEGREPDQHGHGHAAAPATAGEQPDVAAALGSEPDADFEAYDAALPPLPPAGDGPQVHRRTLTVSEQETEVAPEITQRLWTFGGTAPGPVLHGRVGDVFEITLVNDGTIGHSIDFHAGALAPDRPMRTIAPGESLVYRFTAERAGIWMYHCSTMPMSAHIANGMFGAVVIEPSDLAPVDRSYVLVQSELYLGPQGGEVDMEKIRAERPDLVAFNGYADQYAHRPLTARVGERVRLWVLAAGPSRGTSFHVVGGQFDALYLEGAHHLRPGSGSQGGAQVLGLTAAQGGFVELTFPEAGHYPFVNHSMVEAERGARGVVAVTAAGRRAPAREAARR
ncbi:multicopper oxidase domain-containing protein [Nocardioides malaquae]|nr:multicopper oxidase domain-containing protein [Nocardioides malaquae]